ncbi:MAG: GNAT family N-acetyltransferase [Actinomycetota bacterium]
MTNNFEIKKLNSNEIAFAKEIVKMFGFDDENYVLPPANYVAEMLSRNDYHVVIALENQQLIGGLTAYEMKMFKRETTEMFLYEIEVKESLRQRGVAKALIEFLKQICVEKGIVEMFVGAQKDNQAARKLYSTTGGKADEDSVWSNYLFN